MFNFSQLTRGLTGRASGSKEPASDDSLDAFGSEQVSPYRRPADGWAAGEAPPRPTLHRAVIGIIVLATLGLGGYVYYQWRQPSVQAASASLTIESMPAGADVIWGGERRGATPLTLSVAPGEHAFELVHGERRKTLTAVARAGAAVVHHVELIEPASAAIDASLRIVTEPPNLRVLVDGMAQGMSPVTLENVRPGKHAVRVLAPSGPITREVVVEAGKPASVIISTAPSAPAGPSAGWLSVAAPVTLQILEGGNLVGTSASSRILLPVGRHDLQLVNADLGFAERRTVQVTAGSSASIRVTMPTAPLSLNALPWAEAFVDGVRVGETPIGNHRVTIGTHEVVFRHPELGERRQTVTVGLKAPARVSIDMRKPS